MPKNHLKYDPSTTEGKAIARLFRGCKNIENSDGWNGGDIVEWLCEWFDDLGIDPDGPAYQADAIQPDVISPAASPDTVAELLNALPDFTTQSLPAGDEGFFYATYDEPSFDDASADEATIVVFPYASNTRVRTAVAALRRAGYDATAYDVDPRGRTIHVHAAVVYALPDNAPTTDRATRLLQEAGFSRADTLRKACVPSYTTPAAVPWRPGWVQVDVISLPTTGRDAREGEATAQAITTTLTNAGWTVDVRGTETLHTTPPSAEPISAPNPKPTPEPVGKPELVPADVIASVHTLLDYNWVKEQRDYDKQDPEGQKHHIANDLNRIARHWDLYRV